MGVHDADVYADMTNHRVMIETTDRPAAAVQVACLDTTGIRPVILKTTGHSTSLTDPFTPVADDSSGLLAGLGFEAPSTFAELNALSSQNRRQLDALLASISCAYPIVQDATPALVCDDRGTLYLLGEPLISGNAIQDATAKQLDTGAWAVLINLTPAGSRAIASYTGEHNEQAAPQAVDNELVIVSAGRAVSIGAAQEQIAGGTVQITGGDFDQHTCERLAGSLLATPLPLPLRVSQVVQATSSPTP